MNFYNPTQEQRKAKRDKEEDRIREIAAKSVKHSFKDWLLKPLILEACKYLLIAFIAFIGGVYSSDIKNMFSGIQENTQEETQPTKATK